MQCIDVPHNDLITVTALTELRVLSCAVRDLTLSSRHELHDVVPLPRLVTPAPFGDGEVNSSAAEPRRGKRHHADHPREAGKILRSIYAFRSHSLSCGFA